MHAHTSRKRKVLFHFHAHTLNFPTVYLFFIPGITKIKGERWCSVWCGGYVYASDWVYQWQFYDGFVTRFSINLFISIRFDANEPKKIIQRTQCENKREKIAKLVRVKVVRTHRLLHMGVRMSVSAYADFISLFFRLRCALQLFEAYSRFCDVRESLWALNRNGGECKSRPRSRNECE